MNLWKAIILLAVCLFSVNLLGQADQSGNYTPPLAIYHGSDIDTVSFPNQNLHVSIPLLQLKGRGMDFVVTATFNTQTWSTNEIDDPSGLFRIFDTEPGIAGGWSIGVSRMGMVANQNTKCVQFADGGSCDRYVVYALLDTAEGSEISLGDDSGVHGTGPLPTSYWSNDGTYTRIPNASWFYDGLFLHFLAPRVVYKDGVSLNQTFDSQHNVNSVTLEDTNGNEISCSFAPFTTGPSACTDTVGRVIHFNWNANTGNLDSITYQDSSGSTQTISFAWLGYSLYIPWAGTGCDDNSPANCYDDNGGFLNGLTKITLPNGLAYSFDYVTTSSGVTPGQLAKITLPTGGYIRYTYGCSSGPACPSPSYTLAPGQEPWYGATSRILSSDGTAATEQAWTYAAGAIDPTYGQAFTVTDPLRDTQTSYFTWDFFCPPAPSRVDFKDPSGTLLRQILNGIGNDQSSYTDPFPGPFVGPYCNNPRVLSTTTILPDTNGQSETTLNYTTFGNVADRYEYDWGNGQPGPLIRHTNYQFLHNTNAAYGDLAAHILDRITSQSVYDGPSGTLFSQTLTAYDSPTTTTNGARTPVPTTNVVQHDYTNYSSLNPVRGNPTIVSKWLNTTGGFLATTSAFNDVGNLLQITDPKNNITSYSYTDNYYSYTPPQPTSAFVTTTTRPVTNGISHIERDQYYFNTGLNAADCGENFNPSTACAFGLTGGFSDYTTHTYDGSNRILSTKRADGGQTNITYNETSLPISITGSDSIDSTHNHVTTSVYDGLGRLSQTQLTSDPSGTVYQDTSYDALGRKSSTSNPYRTTQDGSYGITQMQYDALNRIIQLTQPDNSTAFTTYHGRATQVQDEGNGTSRVSRITQTDALGRLVSVCEVTSAAQAGGGTPAACNQDIAATGFLTTYQYNVLNNLIGAQQGLVARSFTYDSLSRLLTAINPESGTSQYGYDPDGNVITRIRPAPNQTNPQVTVTTSYQYDALNRVTQQLYSDGTTPTVTKKYDSASELGRTLTNTVGRLSAEYATAANGATLSGNVYSYDATGRVSDNSQCTPQNCPSSSAFPVTYNYNLAGQPITSTNGVGTTFSYAYDGAARLASLTSSFVDNNHPATIFAVTKYSPLGAPATTSIGNVLNESFIYDCRKRLIFYASAAGSAPPGSTTNSSGCPNPVAMNLLPETRISGPVLSWMMIPSPHPPSKSIFLTTSHGQQTGQHGSVTVTLTPWDLVHARKSVKVGYGGKESSLEIARHLAEAINRDWGESFTATARQLGPSATVELVSRDTAVDSSFYLLVSVSDGTPHPALTATVRSVRAPPVLLGGMPSSWMEAR